jgi:RNA polymerase sigma factor for flagellar operon FliA
MSLDELHQFIHQARPVRLVSIEEIAKADTTDKKTLLNQLEDTNTQNPFTQLNTIALKKMMATAIENLPEREKLALSLYYYEDLNLKEIGQVLKISEGRVSQLQTQAMARLKIRLKGILKSTGEFETI